MTTRRQNDRPPEGRENSPPPERTLWQKIKDGAWAAVTAIPTSLLWTAGLFGLSYGAGKLAKDKNFDILHVADAFEGPEAGRHAATENLLQRGMISMALSTGFSGLMGAFTNPAPLTPPANIPRSNPQRSGQQGHG